MNRFPALPILASRVRGEELANVKTLAEAATVKRAK